MRSTSVMRVKRTLMAVLLVFVLSFSTVFAESEAQPDSTGAGVSTETEVSAEAAGAGSGTEQSTEITQTETSEQTETSVQAPRSTVVKKGKYYYFKNPNGKIRKKAGFVTANENRYYVSRGGKIITGKIFKVKKKYYCADKYGIIKTGVYKWKGALFYSNASGEMRRKAGFVTWNGRKYYVEKGGKITVGEGFSVKNVPYAADKKGRVVELEIPDGDGSPVVDAAKAQVGKMTGKTYWVWYYKTRFRDTDLTPWCGAFVAWCYNKAGLYKKITVAKRFGSLGYVPSYSRYADKAGKWVKRSKAKGGDIIVFGKNRHVGLVEGISGNYIITIEGNAGPTAAIGCGKAGAVIRSAYRINSSKIKGIIRPN